MGKFLNKVQTLAMSFDDVTVQPGCSEVDKGSADVRTMLTRQISLNIPIVSAAMDTVTEWELAVALARQGGIGIIHYNLSVPDQAGQVARVKRAEAHVIANPFTVNPVDTLGYVLERMDKSGVSGLPVIDGNGRLIGIVTKRDLPLHGDDSQQVSSFMTTEVKTAPVGVSLEEAREMLYQIRREKLPVVDETGVLRGLITSRDIESLTKYPDAIKDKEGRLLVGAAVGVLDWESRVPALLEAGVDVVVVDSSHAHSKRVLATIRGIREQFTDVQIIGGNVVTPMGAQALIDAGVDAVKVGIGPGSICTTRVVTGGGVPQLSAIMECAEVAQANDIPVIGDGGIRTSGDIVKACAAGANSVMLGGLLARTEEAPGDVIQDRAGIRWRYYRGMGSAKAIMAGSGHRYSQEGVKDESRVVPEGIEARVPCLGTVEEIVFQLVGGLRSGMGLAGCASINELHEKAEFRRVTAAGVQEGNIHDVEPIELPVNIRLGLK